MSPESTNLRALLPPGSCVYTFPVVESRSGMGCRLLVLAVVQGEIIAITQAVADALQLKIHAGQVIFPATRERAGTELVTRLERTLHGRPGVLRHQSLGGL